MTILACWGDSAPSGKLLASGYQPLLGGRRAIISFVTVAELRCGAALTRCGARNLRTLDESWLRCGRLEKPRTYLRTNSVLGVCSTGKDCTTRTVKRTAG